MASTNRLSPIPQPPTKPVVGNMLSLDSTAPVQNLARLAKELGPIFWLDMMGAPIVIVSGHDLVEELSDEKRFDKAVRGPLRRVRAVGGDGLFTADTSEPNWSKAHNILLQPFGNRAMQSYHPSMVDIAEQLVKKWERLNGNEEIDVVHDMTALTLDTIGLWIRLPFQFVLSPRLSSVRGVAGALARDHHDDPRPADGEFVDEEAPARSRRRCRLHEQDGR
jgi:cytochrome P450/NADPH-cytochrome P450 reductase